MPRFIIFAWCIVALLFASPAAADRNYEEFVLMPPTTIGDTDVWTSTVTSDYQQAYIFVTTTNIGADQTVTPKLGWVDPATGTLWAFVPFAAISTNTTAFYFVGNPAMSEPLSIVEYDVPLPRRWALSLVTSNAENVTVTISVIPVGTY